jgi:hypothetical protein
LLLEAYVQAIYNEQEATEQKRIIEEALAVAVPNRWRTNVPVQVTRARLAIVAGKEDMYTEESGSGVRGSYNKHSLGSWRPRSPSRPEEITKHTTQQIRPSITEDSGATPVLGGLIIPCTTPERREPVSEHFPKRKAARR